MLRTMRRLIFFLSLALALVAAPAVEAAPKSKDGKAPKGGKKKPGKKPGSAGAVEAVGKPVVKIVHIGRLNGGRTEIMSTVPVVGTVKPALPGTKVAVSFFRNGKRIERKRVSIDRKGDGGVFRAKLRVTTDGKFAVSARYDGGRGIGADSTVRKSWRVRFPALHQGQCGDVVVGFKTAMRKMGYIANSGRCYGGKTARGVLAYRKVNGMTRSFRSGRGLVKRVFAGRGGYRVRHPGAGTHVEAPLSKQVIVFAKGDRPVAIYPVSSGTSATPTVTGHFEFIRTEPGYNAKGMYYSFYF